MLTEPWPDYRQFRSTLARDLCWLLSPQFDISMPHSVYSPLSPTLTSMTVAWITSIDQAPGLPNSADHKRLGLYFEELVAFYLTHRPDTDIHTVRRNLPLREVTATGTQTLGELDFLYRQGPDLQHLEVAVKFYLGVAGLDPTDQNSLTWIGPDSRDCLDRKWHHLVHHQLPLGLRWCERDSDLSSNHAPTPVSCYWLKGILFKPWNKLPTAQLEVTYHWIHQHQVNDYFAQHSGNWLALPKHRWLGTVSEPEPIHSAAAMPKVLHDHFAQVSRGVMVVRVGVAQEHRCFVVTDDWPTNIEQFDHRAADNPHR